MGELMRPVFTRASRHVARPFQRKSATVSAQLLCKSATVSAQKRDRFSVDNFITHRRKVGVMHKRKDPPEVPDGPGRPCFSAAALWALRAEATGRE